MSPASGEMERLLDLLADRAGGEPLSDGDALELEQLLLRHPEADDGSFERAAAAIHLAFVRERGDEMPVGLGERVLAGVVARLGMEDEEQAGARHELRPVRRAEPPPREARRSPLANPVLGWLAAAAALVLLIVRAAGPAAPETVTLADLRSATDVVTTTWSATGDPGGAGVTGEVLWSDALQTGFMRFDGLAANDPSEGQYQLWIFDAERPAEYPVDGGVFDATGGETLVPIDAKIRVDRPTLFAITYERPGGVVVSTRERLLLTASPQ